MGLTQDRFTLTAFGMSQMLPKVLSVAVGLGMTENNPTDIRNSGWLCVLLERRGKTPMVHKSCIGRVPDSSRSEEFCEEKAYRVMTDGSISSYIGRDPSLTQRKYGGGVRLGRQLIAAFSGLPEAADEAVVMVTATMLGLLSLRQARRILRISGNVLFELLLKHCEEKIRY